VANMSDEERHDLLSFVTGSSIVPACGFKNLRPWFTIVINGTTGSLPVSFPAKHELILSDQPTYEEFDRLLLLALAQSKDKSDIYGGQNDRNCPMLNFNTGTSTNGLPRLLSSSTTGSQYDFPWCHNVCNFIWQR